MISNLMTQIGNHTNIKIEEDRLRHMVLNSLRSYNVKFKAEFGEMIIATDDKRNWRKGVFPYYKANRKSARDKSELDWNSIFESLNKIRDEIRDYFPYRVIQVDEAEADDVIGTLCMQFGNTSEKILIISGDKDFKQLQVYLNVKQYDPVHQKKYLVENNPERFLREHIIRGDRGDGVPNFLSKDDSLINGRQKSILSSKLNVWLDQDPTVFCDADMLRNYKRNQMMVDLSCIPESLRDRIMVKYEEQAGKGREKLFNYFIEKHLRNLLTDIGSF